MNLILSKDGINAYIGPRYVFGLLEPERVKRHGRDGRRCWISLPASTVMSKLGLYLNTSTPEKPVMAFHGSPLVNVLSFALRRQISSARVFLSQPDIEYYPKWGVLQFWFEDGHLLSASQHEVHEAMSYLN